MPFRSLAISLSGWTTSLSGLPTSLSGLARLATTSDPGLGRLRMASRVTLTLGLVVSILAAVHAALALPAAAYGMAMITAMQGALAVRETGEAAQFRTRVVTGLAGFAVAAVAVALEPVPRVADALFVVLVFGAVYARKYGARWNAVGMFAFMCYFIASYLHPAAGDLPAMAGAILLSAVVSHLVRNRVLPEHPAEEFRRTMDAVGRRLDDLARSVEDGAHAGWPPDARRAAVRRQTKLGDAILAAEGYLPAEALAGAADREPGAGLAVALFDLHLASESLLVAHIAETAPADAPARREAARRRLEDARSLVVRLARAAPDDTFRTAAAAPPTLGPAPVGAFVRDPQLRLAIQVALAAGLAMAGGLLVSKTRFFWAILTAFLVFSNTQSRGDTTLRAVQRAAGTLAGIVFGIGLAALVDGQLALSIALSTVFVFAGFYLLQISYGAMTFFVTLVVSLVYGLIGQFSPALLVLRLEETLIGAAAGIFVSFAVLPQTTSAAASGAVSSLLQALDDLLAAVAGRLDAEGGRNLLALSRRLDHRYGALAAAVRPLGRHWQLARQPGPVRIALLRFMALAHWARILARASAIAPLDAAAAERLRGAIAGLRGQIARGDPSDILFGQRRREPKLDAPERIAGLDAGSHDPLFALDVLSHIVEQLTGAARSDVATRPAR